VAASTCAASARVSTTGSLVAASEELGHDARRLVRGLALAVDGLGHALAQVAVVVDAREAQIRVGEVAQRGHGIVGRGGPRLATSRSNVGWRPRPRPYPGRS
jgi:hypothetical protein